MSHDDERDYEEEAANQQLMEELDLCPSPWHYSPVQPTELCPECGDAA